jgi:glycosyltransferase involved in cell wall biosynthesis
MADTSGTDTRETHRVAGVGIPTVKIAINASIVEPFLSGLGVYTVHLARELYALHDDVVVYTAFPNLCAVPASRCRSVRWRLQPSYGSLGHLRRLAWLQTVLPLRLMADRATVLLSPVPEGLLLRVIPQVIVVHDVLPLHFPHEYPRQQYYFRHLVPAVLKRARLIVAVSEHTRRDLAAFYGITSPNVHVVPNGFDAQRYRAGIASQSVKDKYGLEAYLLFVGNLLPHKNLSILLRAFASIAGRMAHQLVIAGKKDPRYYPALEAQVQALGLQGRVLFLDYVPAEDLPALYAGADACVLPSLYEGFGLPVLEAMACGTPVIASRASAIPEVAGEAALLFDPHDVHDMAQTIAAVLGHPDRRETMRHRGLARATQFSWRRTATAILGLLKEAVTR